MSKEILLLDCTLRDGGYVNDWNFGNGALTYIYDRLNLSGMDIIEVGFLDHNHRFDINRSIQPDTASIMKVFEKTSEKKSMIVAMIDYGTCDLKNVQPKSETMLDGIRVIFKKENMYNAIEFGKGLIKKGYALFLNMVSITSYDAEDIIEFSKEVNLIEPFAVSLVDTYGLMHKEQMHFYFNLLNDNLNPSIRIGYHSHNNFQLAYSNTIEILKLNGDRSVILDGSLYGMGKSAGNAPTELLAMHLNDKYNKKYDIDQILEAIDVNILPIYEKQYWGYGFQYYISAMNDCHPNYVSYLMKKRSLSIKDLNNILHMINKELKLKFNEQHIEELYMEYMLDNVDDSACVTSLKAEIGNRHILIIGPGTSASSKKQKIKTYQSEKSPVTISVNFIPELDVDYVFFSNSKRYSLILPNLAEKKVKIIATSNITPIKEEFDYTLNYADLITDSDEIWDNALVILLNFLKKIGVHSVSLAGFDGFVKDTRKNYIDESFDLSKDFDYLSAVNRLLAKKLKEYRRDFDIEFITKSQYEKER